MLICDLCNGISFVVSDVINFLEADLFWFGGGSREVLKRPQSTTSGNMDLIKGSENAMLFGPCSLGIPMPPGSALGLLGHTWWYSEMPGAG